MEFAVGGLIAISRVGARRDSPPISVAAGVAAIVIKVFYDQRTPFPVSSPHFRRSEPPPLPRARLRCARAYRRCSVLVRCSGSAMCRTRCICGTGRSSSSRPSRSQANCRGLRAALRRGGAIGWTDPAAGWRYLYSAHNSWASSSRRAPVDGRRGGDRRTAGGSGVDRCRRAVGEDLPTATPPEARAPGPRR